jgi:hypothetical protein
VAFHPLPLDGYGLDENEHYSPKSTVKILSKAIKVTFEWFLYFNFHHDFWVNVYGKPVSISAGRAN